jgi:CHASE3 domain sensor protein
MNLLQLSIISFCLAVFLVSGSGCAEQEQKSRETGKSVLDTVKNAEKNVNDAVLKMQEKSNELEEADQ